MRDRTVPYVTPSSTSQFTACRRCSHLQTLKIRQIQTVAAFLEQWRDEWKSPKTHFEISFFENETVSLHGHTLWKNKHEHEILSKKWSYIHSAVDFHRHFTGSHCSIICNSVLQLCYRYRYSSTEHRKEILARVQFSCDKLCHCIFSSDIKSKATLMSFVFTPFHPQRTGFNFWTHYFICQPLKGRCTTNLLVNALVIRILAFIHLHGKHKHSATNR